MNQNELFPKLRDMPYHDTKVSHERTKAQIETLLEKYGIEDHQWTTLQGKQTLKFIIDTVVQGKHIKKVVQIDLPEIKARKWNRGSYQLEEVPKRIVYRIFFYALKSILETTQYGLFKLEDIFFAFTLTQLDDGSTVQMKDYFEQHPLLYEGEGGLD